MPGDKIQWLGKMLQVATPNRAPPKLLSRLLKVVDTPVWGAKCKMTAIIEFMGTKDNYEAQQTFVLA